MMDLLKITSRVAADEPEVPGDMKWDTMTVGQLRAALAGVPDETPVLNEEFSGWLSTFPGVTPRKASFKGQTVFLIPTSQNAEAVNADETGGPADLDEEEEPEDPGPPSDPGPPWDTLEEKRGDR